MMDINERHSLLRDKLNNLGFTQPLPFGSLAIVSALFDDLILTNKNLKDARKTISSLEKEKTAWSLGVEPYKCDNSKLLAECNSLHLDMIRQRDIYQTKIFELNKSIRNLEYVNRELNQQCAELNAKIDVLDPKQRKSRNDLLNQKRKPFISTVRSGEFLPSTLKSIENMDGKSKCTCQSEKDDMYARLYAEQEANKVKTHLELMELYKSQLESRNREISRLNQLLAGGRPISALAKDCCYRDISSLAEDIQRLQRQKSEIEANYEQAIKAQSHAHDEVTLLKEQNEKLAKELNEIKDVALSVETEANVSLEALYKRNTTLKHKLNDSKKRIQELESQIDAIGGSGGTRDLKAANIQIKFLQEQLQSVTNKECELKTEVEKLTKKNAKLKGKLSADACKCNTSQTMITTDVGTMTSGSHESCSIDVNRLKIDRDFYQQEYLKLLNKPLADTEINLLRKQLIEKDYEIKALRRKWDTNYMINEPSSQPCKAVEAAMHRLEREKKVLQDTIDRLTTECNELRDSLHLTSTTQRDQYTRDECEIDRLRQRIRQIESENVSLKTMEATSKSTVTILKDEIVQLNTQVTELNEEIAKLRTSSNHMKVLQEQTENALIEHQNRLSHCERQRNQAESRLNVVDSSRTDGFREIGELRAEITRLKTLNATLNIEKDKLINDLDAKTEELYQLEPKMDATKTRVIELEAELAIVHRQINNISSDNDHSKSILQQTTNEVEDLRRQIKQLKHINDNLMFENRRLTNELADEECNDRVLKTKLNDAEKEIDRLKRQLQQYVQEVQRAEELLHRKEEERNGMLEQYKTLSHDAVALEGTNQSLELEAAESKRTAIELEGKVAQLQIQLSARDDELNAANLRVCELTKKINQMELNIDRYKHDLDRAQKELDAERDLCTKLDIEIEKLNAEIHEYSEIRQDLECEIEKLRSQLSLFKVGDKAVTESLKQILSGTRKDLDDERTNSNCLKREIDKLRSRIEELQANLTEEHENAIRQETLAREYHLQFQELKNKMIDDRFKQAAKDESTDRFSSI
ncbi:centrosomal protein of 135 kDa [Contarinia nasturtii]|uniref:centrosomal protein of 135 kDa n=1 Tax=Contarinia nasturtii TaxID=265458 RepID=UPI0012D3C115|nr:centrosomal protein of 135 kDa [Contarinia nasturtii]